MEPTPPSREPIFDQIERVDPSPGRQDETLFAFYNRVSGEHWEQVRDLIQQWSNAIVGDNDYAGIRGSLRSKDDRQHRSAFLELYLHQCFLQAGYEVEIHPRLPGTDRRIDFRVIGHGEDFYVEARTVVPSDESVARSRRCNQVYESLHKTNTPNFYLDVDIQKIGENALSVKRIRSELEGWLSRLDPDDAKIKKSYRGQPRTWRDAGWTVVITPIFKKPEKRGMYPGHRAIVSHGISASWVNEAPTIKACLDDKDDAYGELKLPFIIAIGTNMFDDDNWHMMNALFGDETLEYRIDDLDAGPVRWFRQPVGYWGIPPTWKHRNVSGILIVNHLNPSFVNHQQPMLWEHPAPSRKPPVLPAWRHAKLEENSVDIIEPKIPAWQGLEMKAEWPEAEPFPRK